MNSGRFIMAFLPPEYLFLQPVLIVSIIVFFISLLGNIVFFGNKFLNALVTAIIFGAIYFALTNYGYIGVEVAAKLPN